MSHQEEASLVFVFLKWLLLAVKLPLEFTSFHQACDFVAEKLFNLLAWRPVTISIIASPSRS